MDLELWFADISKLENLLDLPQGFVESLVTEDDWSFVVKTHALIEASVTHILVYANDVRLAEVFRKLQLGGGRTGKLAFVRALDLLDPASLKLIERISELRNSLVHDVRQFSFKLVPYVQQLPPTELQTLARQIAAVIGLPDDEDVTNDRARWLREYPKEAFSLGVLAVLARALFKIAPDERIRATDKVKESAPALALILVIALASSHQRKGAGAACNPSATP